MISTREQLPFYQRLLGDGSTWGSKARDPGAADRACTCVMRRPQNLLVSDRHRRETGAVSLKLGGDRALLLRQRRFGHCSKPSSVSTWLLENYGLNRHYLELGKLHVVKLGRRYRGLYIGTHDNVEASEFVQFRNGQGLLIGAWRKLSFPAASFRPTICWDL
jgi:hypothetical protein